MAAIQSGSPEDWRNKLLLQLSERCAKVDRLEKYYDGDHPLPEPPKGLNEQTFREAKAAYLNLCKLGLTNWVKLIADAPSERLAVTGFRFGKDTKADTAAWDIWQRNYLDADSALVHDNALQTGNSAVLVWRDTNKKAIITPEHSGQMIVAYAPGSRRTRAAALKAWVDNKIRYAVLYMPDKIYKWKSNTSDAGLLLPKHELGIRWEEWIPPTDTKFGFTNDFGVVPVIEFRANVKLKPAPYGGGRGEFEGVLSIQDRINKSIFDRLVTAEFQAFRQRYAIGWNPEAEDAMKAGMARMWLIDAEPKDVTIGEFAQADFTGFIKAVESDVNAMAAITKTPPHYLLGEMVNVSGDALKAAESGLSSKTAKHRDQFSESWEEVMRLAFRAEGDTTRAVDTSAMALWRNVEVRTLGETVDAILKMQALGVPEEALWQMLPDVTPQDIERWKLMQADKALMEPEPVGGQ